MFGSFIAYIVPIIYPTSNDESGSTISERIKNWKQFFEIDKRILIFDIIVWVLISLGYTLWVFDVVSPRQAFLSGLTAEAAINNCLSNIRNKIK